jgi:hypothetical protein
MALVGMPTIYLETAVPEPAWATKVLLGSARGSQVPLWSRCPVVAVGALVALGTHR